MIYLTGDTHNTRHVNTLLEFKKLMKDDDIIIQLGDFGFPFYFNEKEERVLDNLNKSPGLLLFIDGNHEKFPALAELPVEQHFNGPVGVLRSKIWHLKRFNIYTINNQTFLALGGGDSYDKARRLWGYDWFPEEMPTSKELYDLMDSVKSVDYVLSHEVPAHLLPYRTESKLAQFFSIFSEQLQYIHWYCAHIHRNIIWPLARVTTLFNEVCHILAGVARV
jgi:hypothetical protein